MGRTQKKPFKKEQENTINTNPPGWSSINLYYLHAVCPKFYKHFSCFFIPQSSMRYGILICDLQKVVVILFMQSAQCSFFFNVKNIHFLCPQKLHELFCRGSLRKIVKILCMQSVQYSFVSNVERLHIMLFFCLHKVYEVCDFANAAYKKLLNYCLCSLYNIFLFLRYKYTLWCVFLSSEKASGMQFCKCSLKELLKNVVCSLHNILSFSIVKYILFLVDVWHVVYHY